MGQHCRVALHRLQYFKEQTAWHVNDIYLKILLWTVFSRFPFSVEGLPTVFSFNGNAIRTSGDVLKITALKKSNVFGMSSRILKVFWHAYSHPADYIVKLFEVLYTSSYSSSNSNILSNFRWCSCQVTGALSIAWNTKNSEPPPRTKTKRMK